MCKKNWKMWTKNIENFENVPKIFENLPKTFSKYDQNIWKFWKCALKWKCPQKVLKMIPKIMKIFHTFW
jgi:hypothetical protein